jgi:nucleoid-associated protein YgaU
MKILLKLFVATFFTTSLLTACALLPSRNQPLPVAETLPPPQTAEVTATIEVAPVITIPPVTTPASKQSLPATEGQNSKPLLSYTVSEGDLLWVIAKRPDVYGDSLLWPLLYQANRDQIKDPRKIYAGQTLNIPRNVSDEERKNARILAKKFDIFSPD